MSMTGKTTNELFGIGVNSDTFSLFDFNTNFEKADNLIKALQNSTSGHESTLQDLQTTINTIKENCTNIGVTVANNTNNITNISKQVDSNTTNINNHRNIINSVQETLNNKSQKLVQEITTATFNTNWTVLKKSGYSLLGCYTIRDDTNYAVSGIQKRSATDEYTVLINGLNGGDMALMCMWLKY